MADLLWPGDERAGDTFTDEAVLGSMLEVEQAWLEALVGAGIAPSPREDTWLPGLAPPMSALHSEDSGNPVVPMLAFLRNELADDPAVEWLHRGLTSQDVLDTALVRLARTVTSDVLHHLDRQVTALVALVRRHRDDVMAGRTLTQHAVPITFGLKAASWLQGVLDARDDLQALHFPVQVVAPPAPSRPWRRSPVTPTRHSSSSPTSRGGSAWRTTSPGTPVAPCSRATPTRWSAPPTPWATSPTTCWCRRDRRSASCRRAPQARPRRLVDDAAQAEPRAVGADPARSPGRGLAAQVHLAAASMVDERADGAWHLEWSTLATLSRRTLVAASQTAELVEGLRVDTGRMAANAKQHADALLAERRSITPDAGSDPAATSGRPTIIDDILGRAEQQP